MHSKWTKCISTQGNVRGVAIQATELVQALTQLHSLRGEAAHGFSEAVMGALLIASYCKGGERINLNIQSSGRIKQALVDAHPDGSVRGYVIEREGELVEYPDAGPFGEGTLSVLRAKEGSREQPYIGTVPLVTGHIAKDLTFYWLQSEQIPSAVGLAVTMDAKREKVMSAGGFLVQILPGATSKEVESIDKHVSEFHSLAKAVSENGEPTFILSQIFQDTAFVILEEKHLEFRCQCSWDRVTRALSLVGVDELQAMLKEDNAAEVRCDFCTKKYKLDAKGLRELIATAGGKS